MKGNAQQQSPSQTQTVNHDIEDHSATDTLQLRRYQKTR